MVSQSFEKSIGSLIYTAISMLFIFIELSSPAVIQCEVETVENCQNTPDLWNAAVQRKNCSANHCGSNTVYHCLPTEKGQLVEVCANPINLNGASSLGNVSRSTNESESIEVVREALRQGINYIDVAPWYGHGLAEKVLGKALDGIPRTAYYIATKVGRYQPEVDKMFDFSAERTLRSVDESLQRMGLDFVDIIQVHDMEFAPSLDIIINETLPALQKVQQSGKARFIGITGYPLGNFRTVLERNTVKIDTVLSYCRACIHDNGLQEYIPFFQERGIGIINASPIAMGLLSNQGPPDWHPATTDIKEASVKSASFCRVYRSAPSSPLGECRGRRTQASTTGCTR